ncbi:hypothetical protein [Chlamydia avium]|uniref:Uncharacterized protein n=1 Tax=Chlamydia avium 10DC88 TaxID=1229831 RepID=W8JGU6_9CHLA|nr:hypothetical protein [Chlamydia avium]AHK63741.1 Uncharacterized protein M832_08940 [Chlamydia avium 10DC88]
MASAVSSRAVPTLNLSGKILSLNTSKIRPSSTGNCLSQFLTHKGNHLSRFVGGTKNVDKVLKLAKSSAELGSHILDITGHAEGVSSTLKNTVGALSTTRSFISLFNAYNGAIPGCVSAVKSCYKHVKQCVSPEGNSGETREIPYNACYLTKGDHALAAIDALGSAVGASTYVATFGAVRPVLLANKLVHTPFLSSDVKQALGFSVDCMMTANHAAKVIGSAAALAYEVRAYDRANRGLDEAMSDAALDNEAYMQMSDALKESHYQACKRIILTLLEKAFELLADIVKFIPMPHYSSLRLAVISGFTTISSAIGCYALWASS